MDRKFLLSINWPLVGVTAVLFFLGVLNLYSASGFRMEEGLNVDPYFRKQLIWGLMGLPCMAVFMLVDYRHLKTAAWPLFWFTVVMLVAVFFFGKTIYGARRWIDLGFMHFQPSEMAKISVLILGARPALARHGQARLPPAGGHFRRLLPARDSGHQAAGPRLRAERVPDPGRHDPLPGG